jgi:hypothetical protein
VRILWWSALSIAMASVDGPLGLERGAMTWSPLSRKRRGSQRARTPPWWCGLTPTAASAVPHLCRCLSKDCQSGYTCPGNAGARFDCLAGSSSPPVLVPHRGRAVCLESWDCHVTSRHAVQWQQQTRRRARHDRARAAVSGVCALDPCQRQADVDCPLYAARGHASRGALGWR